MKTRKPLLFLTLILLLLFISSCKPSPKNEQTGNTIPNDSQNNASPNDTPSNVNVSAIYSPDTGASLVFDTDGITKENLTLLEKHLAEKTGCFITKMDSSVEASDGEIILGRTSRELSAKAYAYLERMELLKDTEVRYVIYSDGKSVAIAYDDPFYGSEIAQNEAISRFIKEYCTNESLVMESGIYAKEKFCVIDRQTELDEIEKASVWESTHEKLCEIYGEAFADDVIKALKNLYALYTDNAISWIANLFDPVSGGFYYSNSARNTEGYLPDLESTTQALGIIQSGGMMKDFGNDLTQGLPTWFGERIVAFTKGLQDPYNGYFYHPQWSRKDSDANLARLGRDEQSAIRILDRFNAKPYYDTPSGTAGEYEYGVIPTSALLTAPLGSSKVVSVSNIIAVDYDDSAVKEHLRSEQAFREYLEGLNAKMISNDYWVGNHLESQAAQIVARDKVLKERGESYRLADILAEWLTSKQNPETGLWAQGNKNIYDAVNGLLKISSTYSRIGKQVPNAEKGLKSAIEALTSEVDIRHVCDVLNPWYAIVTLNVNITSFTKDTAALDEIRAELIASFPDAVLATKEKLSLLIRPDGSFGYFIEHSADKSQEMPVAVPDSYEGDVNASMIAILSIPQHICSLLGISHITPYTEADRLYFVSIIEELGAIIKDDVLPAAPITFDDENVGAESPDVIQSINSSGNALVDIDPKNNKNQALLIDSYPGTASDIVTFNNTKTLTLGSCFVFDVDMYVSSETSSGDFAQMIMSSSLYMLNISHKNGKIIFTESSSTSSSNAAIHKIGEVANTDEWFNLRIEYYPGDEDTVRIKLYVDGRLLIISDNYYDGAGSKLSGVGTPSEDYISAKFLIFTASRGKMYVDNVLLDETDDTYKSPQSEKDQPIIRGVDMPDGDPIVYDFEDGALPENITGKGVNVSETELGRLLSFPQKDNSIILDTNARGSGSSAGSVSAKVFVPEDTAVGARLAIDFLNFGGGNEVMMSVHLTVMESTSGKYLTVSEGITGGVIGDIRLPLGEAFNLRIDYFFKKSITAIYINDKLTGATFTGAKDSTGRYFGRVKIYSATAGGFSLDNLLAERAYVPLLSDTSRITNDYINEFGNAEAADSLVIRDKALSFANSGIGDGIIFPVNLRTEVPSTFTAEFKLALGESFKNGDALRITLYDTGKVPMLSYDVVGKEGFIFIYSVTENGRYTETPVATVDSLEALTVSFSKRLSVAILYLDGVCRATTDIGYSKNSFELEYGFAEISALTAYCDFSLVSCIAETSIKDFVKDKPAESEKNAALGFECRSSIDLPSAIIKRLSSENAQIRVLEVLRAARIARALYLKSPAGASDAVLVTSTVSLTTPPEAVALESDMLIDSNTEQSVLYIEPMRGSGTSAYRLTVTATKNGSVTISGADIPETVIAAEGEWFKLRLEYTCLGADFNGDGKEDIKFDVYVNGSDSPVATARTPYSASAVKAYELTNVRFKVDDSSDTEIYLDNIFVGETKSGISPGTPGTNPDFVFDPEGDGITVGDGNYDGDGWTTDVPTGGMPGTDSGSSDEDDSEGSDDSGENGDGDTETDNTPAVTPGVPNTDTDFNFGEIGNTITDGSSDSDGEAWTN